MGIFQKKETLGLDDGGILEVFAQNRLGRKIGLQPSASIKYTFVDDIFFGFTHPEYVEADLVWAQEKLRQAKELINPSLNR